MEMRKFLNFRSVPSSPVTEPVQISEFLNKTPIPNPALKAAKWVPGMPTPIQDGLMNPNTEAINLIVGFASGHVTVDCNKWVPADSSTIGAKKTVIAHKEPRTRVLDSEIKLSNIIPGSPAFVPYKRITPQGKGQGVKYIGIGSNPTTLDSGMARSKRTMTKEERFRAKASHTAKKAKKAAEDWKQVIKWKQKLLNTKGDGKTPRKQFATKPTKIATLQSMPKLRRSSAVIALLEIHRFQRSVNLLIPLLPFQRLL